MAKGTMTKPAKKEKVTSYSEKDRVTTSPQKSSKSPKKKGYMSRMEQRARERERERRLQEEKERAERQASTAIQRLFRGHLSRKWIKNWKTYPWVPQEHVAKQLTEVFIAYCDIALKSRSISEQKTRFWNRSVFLMFCRDSGLLGNSLTLPRCAKVYNSVIMDFHLLGFDATGATMTFAMVLESIYRLVESVAPDVCKDPLMGDFELYLSLKLLRACKNQDSARDPFVKEMLDDDCITSLDDYRRSFCLLFDRYARPSPTYHRMIPEGSSLPAEWHGDQEVCAKLIEQSSLTRFLTDCNIYPESVAEATIDQMFHASRFNKNRELGNFRKGLTFSEFCEVLYRLLRNMKSRMVDLKLKGVEYCKCPSDLFNLFFQTITPYMTLLFEEAPTMHTRHSLPYFFMEEEWEISSLYAENPIEYNPALISSTTESLRSIFSYFCGSGTILDFNRYLVVCFAFSICDDRSLLAEVYEKHTGLITAGMRFEQFQSSLSDLADIRYADYPPTSLRTKQLVARIEGLFESVVHRPDRFLTIINRNMKASTNSRENNAQIHTVHSDYDETESVQSQNMVEATKIDDDEAFDELENRGVGDGNVNVFNLVSDMLKNCTVHLKRLDVYQGPVPVASVHNQPGYIKKFDTVALSEGIPHKYIDFKITNLFAETNLLSAVHATHDYTSLIRRLIHTGYDLAAPQNLETREPLGRCWRVYKHERLVGAFWDYPGRFSNLEVLMMARDAEHNDITMSVYVNALDPIYVEMFKLYRQATDVAHLRDMLRVHGFTIQIVLFDPNFVAPSKTEQAKEEFIGEFLQ